MIVQEPKLIYMNHDYYPHIFKYASWETTAIFTFLPISPVDARRRKISWLDIYTSPKTREPLKYKIQKRKQLLLQNK